MTTPKDIPEAPQGNPEEPENAKSTRPTADNLCPNCIGIAAAVCESCHGTGVSEHSATDQEACTGNASLPSSSDTLVDNLRELLLKRMGIPANYYININDPLNNIDTVMQALQEWAYQETLNLIAMELPHGVDPTCSMLLTKAIEARAATKWGKE